MKDLIIAGTTKYTKDQLYNYVESINRCGFDGDKIMVVYEVDDDTIDFLFTGSGNVDTATAGDIEIFFNIFDVDSIAGRSTN